MVTTTPTTNLSSPAVERETPPESTAIDRIAVQHTLNGPTQQHVADRTGDLSREHWTVPVHGLTGTGPDGIVILHMTCGDTRTTG